MDFGTHIANIVYTGTLIILGYAFDKIIGKQWGELIFKARMFATHPVAFEPIQKKGGHYV